MSYNISKVYTDSPLMDEVCYYCKQIMKEIVVKNDVLAANSETENSLVYAEVYYIIHDNGYVTFEQFPFSREILTAYGKYTKEEIDHILDDKYIIPEEDRQELTDFANEYFLETFEEENNYYRTLIGLPPFNTDEEYYIWLTEDDIPANYTGEYDLSLPLHLQNDYLINILYSEGVIDKLREVYIGSNYTYMLFLGGKSIDLYTARKADKWDILYMPNVYYLVEDKFTEIYKINKEIYRNRSYQEYFAESGEYYDQMMILALLSQTFADVINEIPEWYIRRDIFDIKTCQAFLESYGVAFFSIIPLKYQIRIIKNINNLIKYKSTNKNGFDIIDLFGIDGITIYKYWLYKNKEYKFGRYTGNTELQFIASGVNESYDNYITNNRYITPYDDITYSDQYWDGQNSHEYIKQQMLNLDFTIAPTKYESIEYHIPLNEYAYQSSYLLGLILRSEVDISDIRIPVPTIDISSNFKITDLFLYLIILTNSFNRSSLEDRFTEVRYVDIINGSDEFTIDEDDYDWIKDKMPEMYANKTGRVNTFNPKADLDKINEILHRRMSPVRFGLNKLSNSLPPYVDEAYDHVAEEWIDKTKLNSFINPTGYYDKIEDLLQVYYTDTEIYKNLVDLISNADNADDKHILKFIYDELFTAEFDEEYYKYKNTETGRYEYAKDLVELLKVKDYILYKSFYNIMIESSSEARQEMIRNIMNDVISTLEYYIHGDGLEYLFSFTSTESFSAIVYYIYLMVNFFKSFKVHLLDPYITYEFEDEPIKSIKAIDKMVEFKFEKTEFDKLTMMDSITFNKELLFKDDSYVERELVDIFAHYDYDPFGDYDYNGCYAADEAEFEIDGKYAEDLHDQPYITVDGGASYGSMSPQSLHDINGGYADTTILTNPDFDFVDIDGGYAFVVEDERTDCMGSQMFTYDIDGSGADGRRFYSGTMYLHLVGTELFADLIISNKPNNKIEIKEDGLYYNPGTDLAPSAELDLIKKDMEKMSNKINIMEAQIGVEGGSLIYRYNHIDSFIRNDVDSILFKTSYVYNRMQNDQFANDCKRYVDELVSDLYDEINATNAFTWINI